MKTSITINGKTIDTTGGSSITVLDDRIIVDGEDVTPDAKNVTITVYGTVEMITMNRGTILVTDGVGEIKTASGDVEVRGNVSGDVTSVHGDIACHYIAGNARTVHGDIKHRNKK